jgi:hypothetical protein
VDGTPAGKAKLHVYRAGYNDTDTAAKPFHTFEVGTDAINSANRNTGHVIGVSSAFGRITITIDGKSSLTVAGAAPAQGPPATGCGSNRCS